MVRIIEKSSKLIRLGGKLFPYSIRVKVTLGTSEYLGVLNLASVWASMDIKNTKGTRPIIHSAYYADSDAMNDWISEAVQQELYDFCTNFYKRP